MALFLGFKFSRLKLVMYGTAVAGPLGKNRNILDKSDYVKKMDSIYFSKAGDSEDLLCMRLFLTLATEPDTHWNCAL